MNLKFYKQKGFFLTLLASVLVVFIVLITEYKKELFVPESGNIKVFGSIGITLACGLLLKWKYVRQILGVLTLVVFVPLAFFIFNFKGIHFWSFLVLEGCLISIFYLLFFVKRVKEYSNSR